jgi:hypothetical protein
MNLSQIWGVLVFLDTTLILRILGGTARFGGCGSYSPFILLDVQSEQKISTSSA